MLFKEVISQKSLVSNIINESHHEKEGASSLSSELIIRRLKTVEGELEKIKILSLTNEHLTPIHKELNRLSENDRILDNNFGEFTKIESRVNRLTDDLIQQNLYHNEDLKEILVRLEHIEESMSRSCSNPNSSMTSILEDISKLKVELNEKVKLKLEVLEEKVSSINQPDLRIKSLEKFTSKMNDFCNKKFVQIEGALARLPSSNSSGVTLEWAKKIEKILESKVELFEVQDALDMLHQKLEVYLNQSIDVQFSKIRELSSHFRAKFDKNVKEGILEVDSKIAEFMNYQQTILNSNSPQNILEIVTSEFLKIEEFERYVELSKNSILEIQQNFLQKDSASEIVDAIELKAGNLLS